MINKFDIAKALRDQAKLISDNNNLTLVGHGERTDPDSNDTYIEEIALYGDDFAIGIADDSSDGQIGIYQININTPKALKKWRGLEIVGYYNNDVLGFPRGLTLDYNSQTVRIKSTELAPMMQSETHLIHVLSVTYSVIN